MDHFDAVHAKIAKILKMRRIAQTHRMCDDRNTTRFVNEVDDLRRREALQRYVSVAVVGDVPVERLLDRRHVAARNECASQMRTPHRTRCARLRNHVIHGDRQSQNVQPFHHALHAPQALLTLANQRLQQRRLLILNTVRENVHGVTAVVRIDFQPGDAAAAQILRDRVSIQAIVIGYAK